MTVVVVSWVLVLLAVFGVNYSHDVIGEAKMVRLELQRHQLRAWARSGVEMARGALENTERGDCAALGYTGPSNMFAFPLTCGAGKFAVGEALASAGQEHWLPGLRDEASRLPLALADSISLATLPGMTPHGVMVILQAKEATGENRLPPFALLPHLDESSRVCARSYLSRYGDAVNINTAGAEVLEAVGLPHRAAEKLLAWRAGSDQQLGTGDDQRFRALDSDSADIRACALNSEEAAVLAYLSGAKRLTVAPRFFRLVSRGWGERHDGICEIRVILEKPDEGPVRVMEWTEHWLN